MDNISLTSMLRRLWVLLILFTVSTTLAQDSEESGEVSAEAETPAAAEEAPEEEEAEEPAPKMAWDATAKVLYESACAACHGITGDGKGPAASSLNPKPRDFTKALYKFRTTPGGELPTDADIYRTIAQGVVRSNMPAYKDMLTDKQIWQLVEYVKGFSPDFAEYGPSEPIAVPEIPPSTPEYIADGKKLYIVMQCYTCHGADGQGNGPSAATLKDENGDKIPPMNFVHGDFKRRKSTTEVYKTILTGLDGTPMPASDGAFLFPGSNTLDDEESIAKSYSAAEVEDLKQYLSLQPTEAQLGSMSEEEKKVIADQRAFSLVHYVRSLGGKKSFFYKLFVEDTEYTN